MPVRMTQFSTHRVSNNQNSTTDSARNEQGIPRANKPAEQDIKAETAGKRWNKFAGNSLSSRAWLGAAGAAALAPAMLMAPGAGATVSSSSGAAQAGPINNDTNTPVSVAADTLGVTNPEPVEDKPVFPPPGTFAERAWNKVDRNRDGGINSGEIKSYLGRVGVSAGFLGSVHNQAASAAMKEADLNRDGKISKNEIGGLIAKVDVGDVLDENGRVKPELVNQAFSKIDTNSSNAISASELEKHINKNLPEDTWFKSTVASAARKIGMDVLDTNRDKVISRAEFDQSVQDLQKIRASVASD